MHRHTRLLAQPLVEMSEEGSATRKDHPRVHNVRTYLGRRTIQGVANRLDYRGHSAGDRFPDLFTGYLDGLGQPRDQIPAPNLGRTLFGHGKSASKFYLELLGGLGTDGDLVLLLDVARDRHVHVVSCHPDRCLRHDAAQGDHGNLGGASAYIDYHGPFRLADREVNTYSRRQGLLDCVGLSRPGRLGCFLDRPQFYSGHPRGHADSHARPYQVPEYGRLWSRTADEVSEHLLRNLEVGYDAVLQGLGGHYVGGRAPDHALGRRTHGHNLIGLRVHCHYRRLGKHDAPALNEYQRVRRSQVYGDVRREQPPEHTHLCPLVPTLHLRRGLANP